MIKPFITFQENHEYLNPPFETIELPEFAMVGANTGDFNTGLSNGRNWALNLELFEPLAEAIVSNWDCAKFDVVLTVAPSLYGNPIDTYKY